ncbi:MAG: NupC/NupG family nucleoside CNT transporter [Gammaproteobacteria bacterium]|nr:NupC/NupG family nucleoside CNT transporter [Gammaproteobacteria bacterium]MDH5617833.1 NupC/NupG family nucleoside CNT transporter [Gammaproteobacteria bacterium]
MQIVMSLVGAATILGVAYLMSTDRRAISLRTVGGALAIQTAVAAIVLYVPQGGSALDRVVKGVQFVINQGKYGIQFVFGTQYEESLGFTVALNVLPVIVFFAALMSVLYYLGIMQRVVGVLGGWLHKLLGTSHAESVSAVSNIFVGHTDAPLVVRPYLRNMTQSELFAVMTGGCATIAGAVMMGYAELGVELKYLITASFMAAPGGLMMAKILMPETVPHDERPEPEEVAEEDRPVNIFEAIGNGAMTGLNVALSVGAMLIAFVGLIYLVNGLLGLFGGLIGFEDLTVQWLLGKLFAPVAFLLGVPWAEAAPAGSLIGQKLVINEFVAYLSFIEIKDTLTPYTQLVVTFALCGFSNLASIAILLGGLGAVVPARRHDIARLGLKAVIGGTLVNLLNASLAGFFFSLQ